MIVDLAQLRFERLDRGFDPGRVCVVHSNASIGCLDSPMVGAGGGARRPNSSQVA